MNVFILSILLIFVVSSFLFFYATNFIMDSKMAHKISDPSALTLWVSSSVLILYYVIPVLKKFFDSLFTVY